MTWTWVDPRVVAAIHGEQLAEHGGAPGLRDPGLLASALARPKHAMAYRRRPDLAALAATYALGLTKNHPFVDANKRVAYVVMRLFLVLNGHDLDAGAAERVMAMEAVASGALSEKRLAQWIRRRLVKTAKR